MERKILSIFMGNLFNGEDSTYKVGNVIEGNLEVVGIVYKRDGLQNINHRSPNESCYLIKLINELNKEAIFKMIPANFVQEVAFAEIEEKEDIVKVERVK